MAFNCTLNRDLLRSNSCGYSLPEVKDIYLANYADVTASTVSASTDTGCTGEEVVSISLANSAKFYHIEPAKNSVTFEDSLVVEDSGNKYRTHSLTFNIAGQYDACMHLDLDALSLGRLTGMEAETATLQGGGDTNGIQVVLTANTTESAVPLSSSAIATVKGE